MKLTPAIPLDRLETFAEGLDHPEGICLTPDGALFAGGEAGQIYRIEADGTPKQILSTGGFILGLAADAVGRIYAVDVGHRCVWRIDPAIAECSVFAEGSAERPFTLPNWGAFGPDGSYYLSDSGTPDGSDGVIWRVPPLGKPRVWSTGDWRFPNGLAVNHDGTQLFVIESYPGSLVAVDIRVDGRAGVRELLCSFGPATPDGVAVAADGSLVVSCYRPDAVYRWSPGAGLSLIAEDPRGAVLAAPTNLVFAGPNLDELVTANLGRWHLTRIPAGLKGQPLHYPTRKQLGS
jgi:gluconolactonase